MKSTAVALFIIFGTHLHAAQTTKPCPQAFSVLKVGQKQNSDLPKTITVSYDSKALGKTARVDITLPPGFATQGSRAPVVFFLHGRGGQDIPGGFFSAMKGEEALRDLFKSGQCRKPFVVIAPYDDAKSYWREGPKAGAHLGTESLITKELLGILQACGANTLDLKTKPAIGGVSAGGNGALYYGEKHSDLFGQVYALSPVFRADDDKSLEPEDRKAFGRGQDFCEQDIVCRYKKRAKGLGACLYPIRNLTVEMAKDDPFLAGGSGIPAEVTRSTRDFLERLRQDCPNGVLPPSLGGGHGKAFFQPGIRRMLASFCQGFAPSNSKSLVAPDAAAATQ